jgi:ankyrin
MFGVRAWIDVRTRALWDAAHDGDLAAAKQLVESGANVNERSPGRGGATALHAAAAFGYVETAAYLLSKGADVNARDGSGNTPLHDAACYPSKVRPSKDSESRRNHVASMLIEHGADVRATAENNLTPLHLAAGEGNVWLVELLLAHGADPNAQTKQGMTPLHYASLEHAGDDPAPALLLLRFGADRNLEDAPGDTPLKLASKYAPRLAEVLGQSKARSNP